jgi:molybdopterin converting factor small subunit
MDAKEKCRQSLSMSSSRNSLFSSKWEKEEGFFSKSERAFGRDNVLGDPYHREKAILSSARPWHVLCVDPHSRWFMESSKFIKISYLGLVRNVIGCREERIEVVSGITVGELLRHLIERHGEPFRASVFRSRDELRSTALVCVNDRDIDQLEGFATPLGDGQELSVVVGVYPPEGG